MNEDGVAAHAGFPNAAHDPMMQDLNLHALLVPQPHSTYFFRVEGDQWQADGIFDGDIAIIDRSLQPRINDIVAWVKDDAFALSRFTTKLSTATIWGVVTATVHQTRAHQ